MIKFDCDLCGNEINLRKAIGKGGVVMPATFELQASGTVTQVDGIFTKTSLGSTKTLCENCYTTLYYIFEDVPNDAELAMYPEAAKKGLVLRESIPLKTTQSWMADVVT